MTDATGQPVPEGETPDTLIDVWEIDPHLQSDDYDVLWERSWQRMLELMRDNFDTFLERIEDDELRQGVTIKVRLVKMRLADYLESVEE